MRLTMTAAVTVGFLFGTAVCGADKGVIETSKSPHVHVRTVDHDAVRWTAGFWAERFDLCRDTIVPNLYRVLMQPTNSANFCNFQIAAGVREGKFFGNDWGDGDCYKWIEAAAAVYDVTHDAELDRQMDELIAVIAQAQAPDGYLATQIQLTGRPRWADLKFHELYNMGHLLTAAYLWAGAADVCAETGEPALRAALERLWADVTESKLYITGAIGALHHGEAQRGRLKRWPRDSVHEAFGAPYQLPSRTAYNETCANTANAMWNWRMLGLTGDARYADVMERVLYNSLLSGIGLEGRDFFYTNPLRRDGPDVPLLSNDSATRWPDTTPASPVHCFCCPPNVARTIAELQGWVYGLSNAAVWVHLYGGSVLETKLADGSPLRLVQQTDYPWDGRIAVTWEQVPDREIALRLRIPGWTSGATIRVNGQPAPTECRPGSYLSLSRRWQAGDRVELDLPLEVTVVESHPLVEETRGHAAILRGPVVYCLESPDLPAGVDLHQVRLPRDARWTVRHERDLLRGVTVLETEATVVPAGGPPQALYRKAADGAGQSIPLRLIPYYAWSNRGRSQMTVWIPQQ